jgi:hypothetical protein
MNEDLTTLLGTEQTDMETAVMVRQRDMALVAAMHRLLHDLRQFMRAYPMRADAEMPDHDLVWVEGVANGPDRVILDAIKANPVLWSRALPAEVCIVPRKEIERLSSKDHVDYLAALGGNMVLRHAAEADLSGPRCRSI